MDMPSHSCGTTPPLNRSGFDRIFITVMGYTGLGKILLIANIVKAGAELSEFFKLGMQKSSLSSLSTVIGTDDQMENSAISNIEAGDPDDDHVRTSRHYDLYGPERRHQSLISSNSTADNFGANFRCTMSCDWAIVPYHEEADLQNDQMRHSRCPDEDDMSSLYSNGPASLFDYSPSESDTMITADSSAVQQGLTYTNIERMLAVLKTEREKCLGELQRFDAALETIDQLASRKLPGLEICVNTVTVLRRQYRMPFSDFLGVEIKVGTTLKNKYDLPEAAQPVFSGPPEHMGANPLADRKNESHATAITPATAAVSASTTTTYGQNPLVSESKTKEPKICRRCPKTVKDTPALKRHCSEVHKQDIDGNPISVELFPCRVTTCRKHTEPFKRREKLANHIRNFHAEIIEEQGFNAEAVSDSGGNREAARVGARAHHDSAEVDVWSSTMLEELSSQPIEAQSAPVAKACEMIPNTPVDANFQPSSILEKSSGDVARYFRDSASLYPFGYSPLEVDMNRTVGDAAEIPDLARMLNEDSLDLSGVIDPALMQSFPSGGKLPGQSSSSVLPEYFSDLFQQIATEGWPVTVDKTVAVQYDTIDEAKQALLDARKKTLEKLQFINQQIESLEGKNKDRTETVGSLESVESSFF